MNTALEYSTTVVQEGGRRCKKSTLNDLVHLTPPRILLMNPPLGPSCVLNTRVLLLTNERDLGQGVKLLLLIPLFQITTGICFLIL